MKFNNNKGVALFIALSLVFLLGIGVVVVLLSAHNFSQISEKEISRIKATASAEAGLWHAYYMLRTQNAGYIPSVGNPKNNNIDINDLTVNITISGPDNISGLYTIESKVQY